MDNAQVGEELKRFGASHPIVCGIYQDRRKIFWYVLTGNAPYDSHFEKEIKDIEGRFFPDSMHAIITSPLFPEDAERLGINEFLYRKPGVSSHG